MNPDRNLSSLYRQAAREEPSQWLDRAVLEAARKEGQRRTASFSLLRWQAPLALAAVLVLAVGLALRMDDGYEQTPAGADFHGLGVRIPAMRSEAQQTAPPVMSSAPSAPEIPLEVLTSEHLRDFKRTWRPKPLRPVEESLAAGDAAARVEAPKPEPAAAIASKSAPVQEALASGALPGADRDERWNADIAARRLLELRPEVNDGPQHSEDAEQWLSEIERLRREGHEQEAQVRLDAFRERYPDHPLPKWVK